MRLAALLALSACHSEPPAIAPSSVESCTQSDAIASASQVTFTTTLGADHALVGTIWDVASDKQISAKDLVERLAKVELVLLGEKHDNTDHHRLQTAFVTQWAAAKPSVAFEMIDVDEQAVVDRLLGAPGASFASNPASLSSAASAPPSTSASGAAGSSPGAQGPMTSVQRADAMSDELRWERRGWPAWAMYRPVFVAAIDAHGDLLAANFPKSYAKAIAMRPGSIDATTVQRLRLDRALPPGDQKALDDELRSSHCGHMPDEMLGPMGMAQRARDAQMAEVLSGALSRGKKTVLIAGAGHVRNDRGVPWALRATHPYAKVLSVAFVEVATDGAKPSDYAARYGATKLPFDIVWFTPRVDDADPCAQFRGK